MLYSVLAFTLVELAVGLVLAVLIVGLLVWALKSLTGKGTDLTVEQLVKMECASSTRPAEGGEFDVSLGSIKQSILDILTQGFTVDMVTAKIRWRKKGNKCVYTVIVYIQDDDDTITKESAEQTVQPCP